MLGVIWLLAAVGVLGTLYTLSDWITFLKSIDSNLPLTVAANSKICYYLDVDQECLDEAIGHLLSEEPIGLDQWKATNTRCDSILDGQRVYAEAVANSLFGDAIGFAGLAGVTDFELLVQSWVLRVGHHPLTTTYTVFVWIINNIADWKTVHCDGDNLLYDSSTYQKPDFFEEKDCDVLNNAYSSGGPPDETDCCLIDAGSVCCMGPPS